MKNLLFLLLLVSAACAPVAYPAQSVTVGHEPTTLVVEGTPTEYVIQATETAVPEPTATVGYQSTAQSALSTADAAARLMVDATMQSNSLTATSDADRMLLIGWTATAEAKETEQAPTYAPATQTRQAFADGVHATDEAIVVTSMWNTQEAPIVAATMAQVAVDAKYADLNAKANLIFMAMLTVLMLACAFGLIRWGMRKMDVEQDPQPVQSEAAPAVEYRKTQGTVVTVRKMDEGGYVSMYTNVIPCNDAQFTELAERVLNQNVSLAVNNFEGSGTLWTRDSFYALRNYMQVHRYVQSASNGMVVLTDAGREFLRAWLDRNVLPRAAGFAHETSENPMSMSHTHEDHAHESGGGGSLRSDSSFQSERLPAITGD